MLYTLVRVIMKNLLSRHFFWDVKGHNMVGGYRISGTKIGHISKCQKVHYSWTVWPLQVGQICCPETSVSEYQPSLRNTQKIERLELHRND